MHREIKMTNEEIAEKMIAFVATKGEWMDEWYGQENELFMQVLEQFAQFIGVEVVFPDPAPSRKTMTDIERSELRQKVMRELLPHIETMFNLKFKEHGL